jgi:hypothetical protein
LRIRKIWKFFKEVKMKNKPYVLIMILLIGLFFMTAPAQAQRACWQLSPFIDNPAQAQRACWQLSPFIDKIELGYEGHSNHFLVHGKWVTSSYFLPVVGNLSAEGTGWNLGIHGSNSSASFGDWDNCVLDARLDSSFTGPWTLDCGAGGFTNSGTLTLISCPIAESAEDGPAAGE